MSERQQLRQLRQRAAKHDVPESDVVALRPETRSGVATAIGLASQPDGGARRMHFLPLPEEMESDAQPAIVFDTWPKSRQRAWKRRARDPNKYLLQYPLADDPHAPRTGPWSSAEHTHFLSALQEYYPFHGLLCLSSVDSQRTKRSPSSLHVNRAVGWGLFSSIIPGRTGAQCRGYFNMLVRCGYVDFTTGSVFTAILNQHDDSKSPVFLRKNVQRFAPPFLPTLGGARDQLMLALEADTEDKSSMPSLENPGLGVLENISYLRGVAVARHGGSRLGPDIVPKAKPASSKDIKFPKFPDKIRSSSIAAREEQFEVAQQDDCRDPVANHESIMQGRFISTSVSRDVLDGVLGSVLDRSEKASAVLEEARSQGHLSNVLEGQSSGDHDKLSCVNAKPNRPTSDAGYREVKSQTEHREKPGPCTQTVCADTTDTDNDVSATRTVLKSEDDFARPLPSCRNTEIAPNMDASKRINAPNVLLTKPLCFIGLKHSRGNSNFLSNRGATGKSLSDSERIMRWPQSDDEASANERGIKGAARTEQNKKNGIEVDSGSCPNSLSASSDPPTGYHVGSTQYNDLPTPCRFATTHPQCPSEAEPNHTGELRVHGCSPGRSLLTGLPESTGISLDTGSAQRDDLVKTAKGPQNGVEETYDESHAVLLASSKRVGAPSRSSIEFLMGLGLNEEEQHDAESDEKRSPSVSPIALSKRRDHDVEPFEKGAEADTLVSTIQDESKETYWTWAQKREIVPPSPAVVKVSARKPPLGTPSEVQVLLREKRLLPSRELSSHGVSLPPAKRTKIAPVTTSSEAKSRAHELHHALELWVGNCPQDGFPLGHHIQRRRVVHDFVLARSRVEEQASLQIRKYPVFKKSRFLNLCGNLARADGFCMGVGVDQRSTASPSRMWRDLVSRFREIMNQVDTLQKSELHSLQVVSDLISR